jgi:hypothetical protein
MRIAMWYYPEKDYRTQVETSAVTSEKLTKPIRIYCDIDGVVKPFSIPDDANVDASTMVKYFFQDPTLGDMWVEEMEFRYRQTVVDKLAEWSHRDDVDFIWLTAWRESAPYALDEEFGIQSVGYLPWVHRFSDREHRMKGAALLENQAASPSQFVWLDDFANKQDFAGVPYFTHGFLTQPDGDDEAAPVFVEEETLIDPERYLSITTDSWVGLRDADLATIKSWLDAQASG